MAHWLPKDYHSVTLGLTVRDAAKAIEFYKQAFGAKEISRMAGPGGKIGHAELQIGDSRIMLGDEFPGGARSPMSLGGTTFSLYVYLPDVDSAYKQAVAAGAKSDMAPVDMFWGDRYAKVTDPFGHFWGLATHTKDVTAEEMEKGAQAMWSQMKTQQQHG
jgi:PhnB protein